MKSLLSKIQSLVVLVKSRSFRFVPISLASAVLLGLAARPSQAAVLLSETFRRRRRRIHGEYPIAYDGPWVYSAPRKLDSGWPESGKCAHKQLDAHQSCHSRAPSWRGAVDVFASL